MRTFTRLTVLVLLLCPALLSIGCDKYAEDKALIQTLWDELDRVTESRDGAGAVAIFSESSFKWYDELVKKGLDAPSKEVWAMPPTKMREVLLMRHRGTRKKLKGLDGKGYVRLAVSEGWWSGAEGMWAIKDISVTGDWGEAKMYDREWAEAYQQDRIDSLLSRRRRFLGGKVDKPPEYTIKFVKEGGNWRLDETSMHPVFDELISEWAKEEQKSIRDFLMLVEELETDEEMKMSVWEPMKK
jgi:hypothetical protein